MGININIIDRQRTKELLLVIQAFAEGKTIESKYIKAKLFSDNRNPSFSDDWARFDGAMLNWI